MIPSVADRPVRRNWLRLKLGREARLADLRGRDDTQAV